MLRFVVCMFVLLAGQLCLAQGTPQTQADRQQDQLERRMTNLGFSDKLAREQAAAARRAKLIATPVQPKMTEEFAEEMETDPDLRAQYAGFLAASNTGIVKLISSGECKALKSEKKLRSCLQRNANIRGFANSFSFREGKRNVFARSDIALKDSYLITGRHSVQTMVVRLGSIRLDSITLDSGGLSYLRGFKPSKSAAKMDAEFDKLANGVTVATFTPDGKEIKFNYGKISMAEVGMTYAMRSIAYRPVASDPLPKDKDVIVVFRVVAHEKNKNVTIVWKVLTQKVGMEMIS